MKPPRLTGADLCEPRRPDPERVRPEMAELDFGLLRRQEPYAGPLLRPGFREHEPGAALERELERGRLRPLLACAEELQPSRSHQVDEQHELAVLGREQEPFRTSFRPRELPAFERPERRVESLLRRDVRTPCPLSRG